MRRLRIGDRIVLFARDKANAVVAKWPAVPAAMEMVGEMIGPDAPACKACNSKLIFNVLRRTTVPVKTAFPDYA